MNAYNAYGYKGNVSARKNRSASVADTLLRLLRAIYLTVCERVTLRGLQVAATVASFVVVFGLIGGMECGTISVAAGVTLCLVIACVGLVAHFEE